MRRVEGTTPPVIAPLKITLKGWGSLKEGGRMVVPGSTDAAAQVRERREERRSRGVERERMGE